MRLRAYCSSASTLYPTSVRAADSVKSVVATMRPTNARAMAPHCAKRTATSETVVGRRLLAFVLLSGLLFAVSFCPTAILLGLLLVLAASASLSLAAAVVGRLFEDGCFVGAPVLVLTFVFRRDECEGGCC